MMIDKRIEHYQKENARLFKLLIDEKLLQKQDVIIKTINEHEAVIRELKHIKKLNLGDVSNSAMQLKVNKLENENKRLEFMVEHGLSDEDFRNDITLPTDM